MLDSRVDVRLDGGQLQAVQQGPLLQNHLLFGQARNNIETVLKKILQNPNAKLEVNYRGQGSRLRVDLGNGTVIPSLSHLSLGQSVLFNLFCTIVRYADIGDLNKGHQLGQITGLAIIDEIEAHLHENLRFEVLPELISMFPRVQFVVATHSPSFLLGLNKRLGADSYTTFEMPGGVQIKCERFSEFQHSIEHMRGTAAFEAAVLHHVKQQVGKASILTEGDTDPDYIRCALELLGRSDLLDRVEIDWVGAYDKSGNAFNTGDSALNAAAKLFQANPGLLQRRILLLYDCDTNKSDQNLSDLVWQRKVPTNSDNTVLNKGIENLLPSDAVISDDYDERTDVKDYGGSITTRILNKRRFCNRICREQNPANFSKFDVIVRFIDELVKISDTAMGKSE